MGVVDGRSGKPRLVRDGFVQWKAVGGGATRSPAVSADAGAGAAIGAVGAEFRANLLLSSSSRITACSRACLNRCSSSSFSLRVQKREQLENWSAIIYINSSLGSKIVV